MLPPLLHLLIAVLGISVTGNILYGLFRVVLCRPPQGLKRIPGPKGDIIFGNIAQLSARPQREFQQWARMYGELFQIRLGLTNWIYVNSIQATREIFDKQSAYTASRLPTPVASDLIGGDMRFVLMADNAKWKLLRGITHKSLTPSKSITYMPNQDLEAKQLVNDLLVNNGDGSQFYTHVRRFATSVIMTTTYGWRLSTWVSHPFLDIMESNGHVDDNRTAKISKQYTTYFTNCQRAWSQEPTLPMQRLFFHAYPNVYNGGGRMP